VVKRKRTSGQLAQVLGMVKGKKLRFSNKTKP
jgi:hypothetical protein